MIQNREKLQILTVKKPQQEKVLHFFYFINDSNEWVILFQSIDALFQHHIHPKLIWFSTYLKSFLKHFYSFQK